MNRNAYAIALRRRGVSPTVIAERMGITRSAVSKIFARARLRGEDIPAGRPTSFARHGQEPAAR